MVCPSEFVAQHAHNNLTDLDTTNETAQNQGDYFATYTLYSIRWLSNRMYFEYQAQQLSMCLTIFDSDIMSL